LNAYCSILAVALVEPAHSAYPPHDNPLGRFLSSPEIYLQVPVEPPWLEHPTVAQLSTDQAQVEPRYPFKIGIATDHHNVLARSVVAKPTSRVQWLKRFTMATPASMKWR
jgi:hypothetical protein